MTSITVHLHTILQRITPEGPQRLLTLEVPQDSTMEDLLEILEIQLPPDALLLAVNGRIAHLEYQLAMGDQVRIMPAMSGGTDSSRGWRCHLQMDRVKRLGID